MNDLKHLKYLVLIQKGISQHVMVESNKGSMSWNQAKGSVGAYEVVEQYINNLIFEKSKKVENMEEEKHD